MILIADSGASKTDWACVSRTDGREIRFSSQGYNPNYISGRQIVEDILHNLPQNVKVSEISEIFFYGAGVTPSLYPFMKETLLTVFTKAKRIEIAMDTLASCRALLQNKPGFAAILGTGANSCLYDGFNEGMNVDSCGFILGDEGSGAYLGKQMIVDYLRRNMPQKVYELVGEKIGMSNDEILDTIYVKPFPNRFCAQYARFIAANLDFDSYFRNLVTTAFRQFFKLIVTHYPNYQNYSFNAVGGVAYQFPGILESVVKEFGMPMGKIMKAPMDGLVEFHLKNN